MSAVTVDTRSDWRWHAERAAHHRALDTKRVHLISPPFDPVLYGNVTAVEPGGTSRLGVRTDAQFVALDPASGLEFAWSLSLEQKDHGYGDLKPDFDLITSVAMALPKERRHAFILIIDGLVGQLVGKASEHNEKASLLWAAAAQANAIRARAVS